MRQCQRLTIWSGCPAHAKEKTGRGDPRLTIFVRGPTDVDPKDGDPRLTQRGPRVDLRPLLCDLQEATHTNTQGQLTIAWCPDHVVVGRTRSAHAGAPSGMLFIEQKGQEFIFCESWQRPSRPCHSSWCFLFHLRPSSLLKPTGSTPEFHTAVTKPTLGPGHGGVCHRDSVTVQGE